MSPFSMKISVIIPNYNGESLLKRNIPKTIEAIADNKDDFELIIVDDASTDNSLEVLEDLKEKFSSKILIKVFKNDQNMGFSSTVNRGVKESSGDILILLNTDVEPQKKFLENLLPNFEDEKMFAVGCLDRSEEGSGVVERGRGIGAWKRGFLVHSRGDVDKRDTLWVSGGSGAFRKNIWERLGGLDEIFNPFYWEDIDLSYRALKSGYKIVFENKSIVTHRHSVGAIKSNYSSREVKEIAYRNQFLFVWKNADFRTFLFHLIWLPYHFLRAILNRDFVLFIGFCSALGKILSVFYSRRKSRKFFVKSDGEIVKGLEK